MFEATASVFNITDENNSFSITIPGDWNSKSAGKTIDKLIKLLELRSQNEIKLHVEEVRKRGYRLKRGDKENKLSDLHTFKKEILEELKKTQYDLLEAMVFRIQLIYKEITVVLDFKLIPSKRIGYSLKPGIYEITNINKTLKYILLDNVKVKITSDDIRLKTILNNNQTLLFTKKSFFCTILAFTEYFSGVLGDF